MANYGTPASNAPRGVVNATIASGQALSDAIDLRPYGALTRIGIPSAWTTADITFLVSSDGGTTYSPLYDLYGNEIVAKVGGTSREVKVPFETFMDTDFIKLRSGTTGAPVNQSATRTLTLTCVP